MAKRALINPALLSSDDLLSQEEVAALQAENHVDEGGGEPVPKPAPEPEPKPAAVAEPAAQSDGKEPKGSDTVPHARFNEVINERNQLRQEKAELQARWAAIEARADERKKMVDEAVQRFDTDKQKADVAAQRPDPTLDPTGAKMFDMDQEHKADKAAMQAKIAELEKGTRNFQEQQSALGAQTRLESYMTGDFARARSAHPDYDAAAKYATEKRLEFWQGVGYSPEQANQIVNSEALGVAVKAMESGQSAGEHFYNVAKMLGYQPAANGSAAAAVVASPAQEKLNQIKAGQAMQGLGGATPRGGDNPNSNLAQLTALDLANMSEEDFVRHLQTEESARALRQSVSRAEGLIE